MINNIEGKTKSIIKICFSLNSILLLGSIFYFSKGMMFGLMSGNIILLGSFLVLEKYLWVFENMLAAKKIAKNLNNTMGKLHG